MATKNLLIRGGADFSGMKKEMQRAQKALDDFQNKVSSTMKKIGTILGTLAVGKLIKDSTQMAMTVESATDNIRRNMGQAAEAFEKWAETQSKAWGMGRADAYKYGSVFSNLLSSFSSSAEETAKNTQELMKAAAIIASKTGRTYEDAAERIRSGMLGSTEAIEDLGVYVNISMIESTEAFRKFAGDKSWSQLDFQTQQQIRLAAILEQTYARYGDTLADTTQTRHAQFVASLQNIKLSLGQAFLPIYNAVLPALTAMANAIGRVVNVIAQFFQALFGKSAAKQATQTANAASQQAGAVTDLGNALGKAGKAAKKAQGGLAGFDEITNIKGPATSGGGDSDTSGGVGGISSAAIPALDTTAFTASTMEVSKKVQEMADRVKAAFGSMKNFLQTNSAEIISVLAGLGAGFAVFKVISNWKNIVGATSKAFTALKVAMAAISGPAVIVGAIIGGLVAAIVYLWQTNEDFRNKVSEIWENIKSTIGNAITVVWEYIQSIGARISEFWSANGEQILQAVQNVFNGILAVIKFVMPAVQVIIKAVWEAIKDIIDGVLKAIMGAIKVFTGLFTGDWKKVWEGVKQIFIGFAQTIWGIMQLQFIGRILGGIRTFISNGLNIFKTFVTNAKNEFVSLYNGIMNTFNNILKWINGVFKAGWSAAWNGIKTIFSNVFNGLFSLVKSPFNKIIDALNTLIGGLNKLSFKIPDWVPGIGGKKWGINIPKIPKLAQGGYVGANNPMLAIIGDNRMEGEIVAPESKIYEQAFRAISDALRQNGGGNLELTINLGTARVFHEIIRGINNAQRQAGRTLLEV